MVYMCEGFVEGVRVSDPPAVTSRRASTATDVPGCTSRFASWYEYTLMSYWSVNKSKGYK